MACALQGFGLRVYTDLVDFVVLGSVRVLRCWGCFLEVVSFACLQGIEPLYDPHPHKHPKKWFRRGDKQGIADLKELIVPIKATEADDTDDAYHHETCPCFAALGHSGSPAPTIRMLLLLL